MAAMGDDIRERTDALDAAGNTTAAIGKGFAIGSAALVSLALFGAYVTQAGITVKDSSILDPEVSQDSLLQPKLVTMMPLSQTVAVFFVSLYGVPAMYCQDRAKSYCCSPILAPTMLFFPVVQVNTIVPSFSMDRCTAS